MTVIKMTLIPAKPAPEKASQEFITQELSRIGIFNKISSDLSLGGSFTLPATPPTLAPPSPLRGAQRQPAAVTILTKNS